MFNVDFNRFVKFHKEHHGLVTLFTHPNNHPYDSGLIIANEDKQVEQWLTKEDMRPEFYQNRVNAGLHVLSPEVLNTKIDNDKVDLDRQILKNFVVQVRCTVMTVLSMLKMLEHQTDTRVHVRI